MKSRNNQRSANDDFGDEPFRQSQKAKTSSTRPQAAASHPNGNGHAAQPKSPTSYPTPSQVERFSRQVANQTAPSPLPTSGVVPKSASNQSQTNRGETQPQTIEEQYELALETANEIEHVSVAAVLHLCDFTGYGRKAGLAPFLAYRNGFLKKYGQPSDPVEVMLVEQLMLGHEAICSMHVNVHNMKIAKSADGVALLTSSLTRLTAEFRKTALALKQYTAPPPTPQYTVVRQQNVAGGDQQVAYVENQGDLTAKKSSDSKLPSKPLKALTNEPRQELVTQPEKSGGRKTKPVEAPRPNPGGTAAASRRRPDKPAVAKGNGTKNCRR